MVCTGYLLPPFFPVHQAFQALLLRSDHYFGRLVLKGFTKNKIQGNIRVYPSISLSNLKNLYPSPIYNLGQKGGGGGGGLMFNPFSTKQSPKHFRFLGCHDAKLVLVLIIFFYPTDRFPQD